MGFFIPRLGCMQTYLFSNCFPKLVSEYGQYFIEGTGLNWILVGLNRIVIKFDAL